MINLFNNLERIAAERIGRETVQYVAYRLIVEQNLTDDTLGGR